MVPKPTCPRPIFGNQAYKISSSSQCRHLNYTLIMTFSTRFSSFLFLVFLVKYDGFLGPTVRVSFLRVFNFILFIALGLNFGVTIFYFQRPFIIPMFQVRESVPSASNWCSILFFSSLWAYLHNFCSISTLLLLMKPFGVRPRVLMLPRYLEIVYMQLHPSRFHLHSQG